MSLYWGSEYRVDARTLRLPLGGPSIRKTVEEAAGGSSTPIRRLRTLAATASGEVGSYFEAFSASRTPEAPRAPEAPRTPEASSSSALS